MEQPEQSSRKPRYSREHVSDQDINSDMGEEVEIEGDISVENGENPKSAFRTESIRGQEGNGHIWRQLQTAGIFGRKRWSGIMLQRKEGRKRRLPEKKKQPKENLPVTGKLPK